MSTTKAPIENKVWAQASGGGLGAALTTFLLWLLGILVWNAPSTAEGAQDAIGAVPFPVVGLLFVVITLGGGFLGGYLAKHTPRPEDEVAPRRELIEDDSVVDEVSVDALFDDEAERESARAELLEEVESAQDSEGVEGVGTGEHYPVPEYANVRHIADEPTESVDKADGS